MTEQLGFNYARHLARMATWFLFFTQKPQKWTWDKRRRYIISWMKCVSSLYWHKSFLDAGYQRKLRYLFTFERTINNVYICTRLHNVKCIRHGVAFQIVLQSMRLTIYWESFILLKANLHSRKRTESSTKGLWSRLTQFPLSFHFLYN